MPRPSLRAVLLLALLTLVGCSSAESRAVAGDEYMLRGQHSLALREYQVARRKDPRLFEIDRKIRSAQIAIYLGQGDRAIDAFRWSDAERALGEVRRLEPDHPELPTRFERLAHARADWHFDRGQKAMARGDVAAAIPEFEHCLALRPDHPRAAASITRAETELKERRVRAESAYRSGIAARDAGDLAEALRRFDETLLLDPSHPGAALELESTGDALVEQWIAEGEAAVARDDWSAALGLYEKAHEFDPRHRGLADRVRIARNEVEALTWISSGEDALAHDDLPRAFTCFEHALHLTSRREAVESRFRDVRDLYARTLAERARTLEDSGEHDGAIATVRVLLDVDPDHPGAAAWLTDLTVRLDDAEEFLLLARSAVEHGDLIAARGHFLACLESIPDFRDVPARLAAVEESLQLAEGLYERACLAQREKKVRRARILFEECLAIARPFRDSEERLERMRERVFANPGLPTRYEEGCRAQARRDAVTALECFLECERERPGAEDVATRITDLRATLERARTLHRRGVQAEARCDLETASAAFAECLELANPFEDASARLARIEDHRLRLRRAERREGARDLIGAVNLYREVAAQYGCHTLSNRRIAELDRTLDEIGRETQEMAKARRAGEPRRALAIALGIRARCSTHPQIDETIATLTLESDYADAAAFEAQGNHRRAARLFQRVATQDPKFRDAAARARANLAECAPEGG